MSRSGKVDTGDEWTCPDGWREVSRGLFRHEDGAVCVIQHYRHESGYYHHSEYRAWSAAGEDRGGYAREDGWLDAAMREALR
jgi:hypothetical protein